MSTLASTTQPRLIVSTVESQAADVLRRRPHAEENQVYSPIASSMMLIWLSEGDRIFGGLSVRGAVEWKMETKSLTMDTFSSPVDCEYD